jgi:Fic family protein
MARKPFRVEVNYSSGKPKFYLARDVKIRGKKGKVRKYLGSELPSSEKIEALRREFAFEMEMKAALKKADLSSSFYASNHLAQEQINNLERIRFLYEVVTEFMTTDEIETYEKDFEIHYIQGTTSIEGNTISLNETRRLLEYGIVPGKKSLREVNEVQNFANVVRYRNSYRGKVTIDFIKNLHALIVQNIDLESGGIFRRVDSVAIVGSDLRLTPAMVIEDELQKAIDGYYEGLESGIHPFELAVGFHHTFEVIHPFIDGNGRVGREVLNYMLMRSKHPKYPRLLFLGGDRNLYLDALKAGDDSDLSKMIRIFADLIMGQRKKILEENLRQLSEGRQARQTRLFDFQTDRKGV